MGMNETPHRGELADAAAGRDRGEISRRDQVGGASQRLRPAGADPSAHRQVREANAVEQFDQRSVIEGGACAVDLQHHADRVEPARRDELPLDVRGHDRIDQPVHLQHDDLPRALLALRCGGYRTRASRRPTHRGQMPARQPDPPRPTANSVAATSRTSLPAVLTCVHPGLPRKQSARTLEVCSAVDRTAHHRRCRCSPHYAAARDRRAAGHRCRLGGRKRWLLRCRRPT